MSHIKLAATALLSCALVAPAVPAVASTGSAQQGAQVQHCRGGCHGHGGGGSIAGRIEDIDASRGEIRIDPRRGGDKIIEVRRYTHIWLNGDRVGLRALDVGDGAYVKYVKKHGDRFALKIIARG